MAGSTKISLFLGLVGIALIALFLWTVFLSGDPLLTSDIWQIDESMSKKDATAWRKNPEAYAAPVVELRPEMNPIAISIAHWSKAGGLSRSSKFTMEVRNPGAQTLYSQEISLKQKKNEGSSDTAIFEWAADTATLTLLPEYLEVTEAVPCTFLLRPGEQQEGNHSRLQLRLRQQAMHPQWWMFITGFLLAFTGPAIFMMSGMNRMKHVLDLPRTRG